MSKIPETIQELQAAYNETNKLLRNPELWKCINDTVPEINKSLCIYTLDPMKLATGTWQLLQEWLEPIKEYGILYDISTKEKGRLHFTLYQSIESSHECFQEFTGEVLKEISGLSVIFRGLLITPTGIALRGFPRTDIDIKKVKSVRTSLDNFFSVGVKNPYSKNLFDIPLFHWTKAPSKACIEFLQNEINRWDFTVLATLDPFEWHLGYGSLTMRSTEIQCLKSFWTPLRIAHRGLTAGPNRALENSVEVLTLRKEAGLHSEIDIWWKDGSFWIGHDEPREQVSLDFLSSPYFWIHAKHSDSFYELQRVSNENALGLRIFYHTVEDYALTTTGDTIICPGREDYTGWVYIMPEMCSVIPNKSAAICSDFP